MGLFGWFKGRGVQEDRRLAQWRSTWAEAARSSDAGNAAIHSLRQQLEGFGLPEEEIEVEREMLEGLERVLALPTATLPVVETGHRVVGRDICHFSAPVSMPDEPAQPTGRLLLTSARAIFVGGPNGSAVAWHKVADASQIERDLVLVRNDRERLYRYRCNTYGDAMEAAALAKRLLARRGRG